MSQYVFDSSALLKRYHPERGSAWVLATTQPGIGNTIFIAKITAVEIISGIERLRRNAQLSILMVGNIRQALDHHLRYEYKIVGLTDHVVRRAQSLLGRHPLRAYDAVQLASALAVNSASPTSAPLIFVSADTRLLAAATVEGLPTADPNVHP